MQIDVKLFHDAFFDEATEHLTTIEQGLLMLEDAPNDESLLNEIFRAAHSIKGSGGSFGFSDIAGFTHELENLLDHMRDGRIVPTAELIGLMLQSTDTLAALIGSAKEGLPSPGEHSKIASELAKACGASHDTKTNSGELSPAASETSVFEIKFVADRHLFYQGVDPLLLLRDLSDLGELLRVELHTDQLPAWDDFDAELCYLAWTIQLKTAGNLEQINNVFVFVDDTCEVIVSQIDDTSAVAEATTETTLQSTTTSNRSANVESSSIRVAVEKVDELINLVGELVIAQSMIGRVLEDPQVISLPGATEALAALTRSSHDIQERVMAVRMVPLSNVFRRVPRLVRDLSDTMGKSIRVEITGEETEIDKQMIERIGDPLTHLVRNAVDHGIELPAERIAAGKNEEGIVSIGARHEGGNVVIEISDDGAGMNPARIRAKAIAKGLISEADNLSEDQMHSLVFAAGFSTAETVSDVSGRGVGMDVVKRNIEALNGSVSVESRPGSGTTFCIRLPLTMAIVEGLSVGLNNEIYILPLLSVVESLQPYAGQIKTISGKGEVLLFRDTALPLVRLSRVFHCSAKAVDPEDGIIVILECGVKRIALLVDELVGQTHAVMKSLEANYQKVEAVSGATILGDGQVAFVLDVAGLCRLANKTVTTF